MKSFSLTLLLVAGVFFANAQQTSKPDTAKKSGTYTAEEVPPEFPGGVKAFNKFISKNLKYPEVALLIGLNGRVIVSFVVDQYGKVSNANSVNCLGAGCESEAARVISLLPTWKPGSQDGRPVRVMYSVPIDFYTGVDEVYFSDLKSSSYGFVFEIDGKRLTLDEARQQMGRKYKTKQLTEADPFYNADNDPKFNMPDKKAVYLLKIKS